jgi:hypothetical protein
MNACPQIQGHGEPPQAEAALFVHFLTDADATTIYRRFWTWTRSNSPRQYSICCSLGVAYSLRQLVTVAHYQSSCMTATTARGRTAQLAMSLRKLYRSYGFYQPHGYLRQYEDGLEKEYDLGAL